MQYNWQLKSKTQSGGYNMNFKTDNHEKHYILWDEIVKKLKYFKDSGGWYIREDIIYTLKEDICENHPNLDGFSCCYACNEANKIRFEKKSNNRYCSYCPIDPIIDNCKAFNSLYQRLCQRGNIDTVIDLATKIRDAEWRI